MPDQPSVILCVFGLAIALVAVLATIFYIISLYSALKLVPEEKRKVPAWFCWMFLIPIAGYVFQWIVLPFGIPRSFREHMADNAAAVSRANTLYGIGLSMVILPLLCWIPLINILAGIAIMVLWIIYWVKVVSFKRQFLLKK